MTSEAQDRPFVWRAKGFRQYRPPNRISRGMVSVAPWVNLALLLLLFYMINAPFILQPGVRVDLPEAPFTDGTRYGHVVVVLSQEAADRAAGREEIVYFDDERFILGRPGQPERLRAAFVDAVRKRPDAAMVLEADRRVEHGTIVRLLNMAAEAGVREVNIGARQARNGPGT